MDFGLTHNDALLLWTAVAVAGLVVLIAVVKLNAFVALILTSLGLGLASGMELTAVGKAFQDGVGGTLGFIAVVVGLGTMLGKMLAESGGAEVIARTLIRTCGKGYLPWAVMLVAFIIGLPVFFGVGVVLLVPIVFTLARETKTPLLRLGIPMVAGLSASHGLVPPHPGVMAAIAVFESGRVDVGKTILYGILVGLPVAVLAGPIFAKFIAAKIPGRIGGIGEQLMNRQPPANPPSFGTALFTISLPVLLMLLATLADVTLMKGNRLRAWADFFGSPVMAMLVAVLVSFVTFGTRCGFDRSRILKFTEDCVGPAAAIMLVVGAGGGFSKVIDAAEVDQAIVARMTGVNLSPLLLGWLITAVLRVAVGSATVAITLAAGIMAPLVAATPGVNLELLIVAMGAGSLILSHLNDGGFWFVKEYLNLSVTETLKTWTVLETIISVAGLLLVLALDALIRYCF